MAEAKVKDDSKKPDIKSILSKEEKTAPKKEGSKPSSKDKGKARHKHTHMEHHYDSSGKLTGHTIRHEGGGADTSYVAKDLDEVHDGLEEHLGEPNGDEGQSQPAAQAPPEPMPQPTPQGV